MGSSLNVADPTVADLFVAEFDTRFGTLRVASTEQGLAYVQLSRAAGRGFAGWCKRHAPEAKVREAWKPNQTAIRQITQYLEGKCFDFDLPLDLRATDFQRRVYDALLDVPYGETRTYAQIAKAIGQPKAVRAVGTANGANPLSLVVPCHRIVATGGKLGGYAGGLRMKKQLLAMERSRPREGSLL